MRPRIRTFDAIRLAALRRERSRVRRDRRLTVFLVGILFATTLAVAVHDGRAEPAAVTVVAR